MATIGSLHVNLSLDSAQFISDMNNASSAVQANTAAMQSSLGTLQGGFTSITGTVKGLIAALGVYELINFTNQAIATAEKVSEAANKLGLSTKEYQTYAQGLMTELQIPPSVIEAADELKNTFDLTSIAIKNGFATGLITSFGDDVKATKAELNLFHDAAALTGLALGDMFQLGIAGVAALIGSWHDLKSTGKELDDWIDNSSFGQWLQKWYDGTVDGALEGGAKGVAGVGAAAATANPAIEAFRQAIDKLLADMDKTGGAVEGAKTAFQELIDLGGNKSDFWEATTRLTQTGELFKAAFKELPTLIKQTESPLERYRAQLEKVNLLQEQGAITAEQAARAAGIAAAQLADPWVQAAGNISSALQTAFSKNKAFAEASAVISALAGGLKTYEQYGFTPVGIALMASGAAMAAAQIAQINATTVGSAGTLTGPSSAASAAHSAAKPAAAPVFQQAVAITLQGDTFGRAQLENFVAQLKIYQKDGGTILIN